MAENDITREENIAYMMVEDLKKEEKEETKENKENRETKAKKPYSRFIISLVAFIVTAVMAVCVGMYIESISSYNVYREMFATAWSDECKILQDRYSIMIIDNRDYLINSLQDSCLKYGVVESKNPNLTNEELSMISRYKVNNFDENFDITRCNVFSTDMTSSKFVQYDMSSIFGYAILRTNDTYLDDYYADVEYEYDEKSDTYVYSEDGVSVALGRDGAEREYIYVVSYVTEPEKTGHGLYGVDDGYGTLTNPDLFIQLWVWLQLAYSLKYVAIVVEIVLCIILLCIGIYWLTNMIRLMVKVVRTLSHIPRTIIMLLLISAITFIGCLFLFDFVIGLNTEGSIFLWFIGNFFIIWPICIYYSYNAQLITEACEKLASGDMNVHINKNGMIGSFRNQADSINTIRDSINMAVEERMKSERLKTELITNVSHDIKTPLTSIINYVDLLGREEFDNPEAREYIDVLSRQSARLKKLIIDLIEASKATTGNVDLEMMPCDAKLILEQVIGEYEEKMAAENLSLVVHMPETSTSIMADSKSLFRVFDNLLVNIQKYSMPGTRAYVDLESRDNKAVFVFRNMSKEPLVEDGSMFMERFYQGDISRNAEGNGLGLAVSKSLTELMGGNIEVLTDGDLFKVIISFDSLK